MHNPYAAKFNTLAAKKERAVGCVLTNLGVDPESEDGRLLSPAIRANTGYGHDVARITEFLRPVVARDGRLNRSKNSAP